MLEEEKTKRRTEKRERRKEQEEEWEEADQVGAENYLEDPCLQLILLIA